MSDMDNKFSGQWSVVSGRGAEKGFNLIEVLIITAIIGVLTTIAVMNFSGIIDSYKARGAASHLYSDMQLARLRAIKEGKEFAVEFTGTTYCVKDRGTDNDWDAGCTAGAGDTIVKSVNIGSEYSGVSLNNDYGGVRVEFNPNGTATNFGEFVCNKTKGQEITVTNNTGNIRVISGTACP